MTARSIGPTLDALCELPLAEPPALPRWTENYCLQAWSPHDDHGFWLHLGLPVYDSQMWHDMVIVYLPGGTEVLVAKGFAPRAWQSGDGPAGSMLRGAYDAASGVWNWEFHGAAQRARRADLERAPQVNAPAEPLRFALRYTPRAPVWDASGLVREQSWSVNGAHWEQHCDVDGWVEYDGKRTPIAGTGLRDHSRGARNFQPMGPHFWLHGLFDDGSSFAVLHVGSNEPNAHTLSKAYVVRNGVLEDAEVVSLPGDRRFSKPVEIAFRDSHGLHRVTGHLHHEAAFSIHYPNELCFGLDHQLDCHWVREGQVRWTWNGRTGWGLAERSVKVGADGRENAASLTAYELA